MKKVNEIFYSIQGEGYFSGTPAVFVRFSGCNLKCPFCDTEHQGGKILSDEEIVAEIDRHPALHVVLTGGEPCLQITYDLVDKIKATGRRVQIETNGTLVPPINVDWVTCSPKADSKTIIVNPNELKVVYTGQDMSQYNGYTAGVYYLQPCSCQNTEEVINYIKKHPKWKLSLQTHKILNVR